MANTLKKKEAWVEFLDSKMLEIRERAHDLACPSLSRHLYSADIAKIKSFEDLKKEHQLILRQAESLKAAS